jgi:beta-galactosidase/beta-glucuronidase
VALSALAAVAPQPTGGWQTLDGKLEGAVNVVLPASVEEYLTPDGKVDTYLPGVYWFWRDVDIPASWQGKTVRLRLESYRLRAEVFVNEQLVGYDIVGDIPYSCDITKALKAGAKNRIAVRITNPGGNKRGWEDYPEVKWGAYSLPASRNFGGINGYVELIATDATFIDDVFVKNLNTTDYRTVEVQTSLNKPFSGNAKVRYELLALSTLRFRVFAIGAYFQKINGNLVLMIAPTKKRRRWFADLWNYPLKLPLLSNA